MQLYHFFSTSYVFADDKLLPSDISVCFVSSLEKQKKRAIRQIFSKMFVILNIFMYLCAR